MLELDDELYEQVTALCAQGDELAERKSYAPAIKLYRKAWSLLPAPQEQWEAATWILAALGDANFLSRDYAAARENFADALGCPDGQGNPFIHMRLGQCRFEMKDLDKAAAELARAYTEAGDEVFEEEDPKYLAFLRSRR